MATKQTKKAIRPEPTSYKPQHQPPQPAYMLTETHHFRSSPIPIPQEIQDYESAVPGSGSRIIKMAEDQVAHRIAMENRQLDADIDIRNKIHSTEHLKVHYFHALEFSGQILGWLLSAGCVAGSVYNSIHGGSSATSIALVSLPVVGLVEAIRGKLPSSKQEKAPVQK